MALVLFGCVGLRYCCCVSSARSPKRKTYLRLRDGDEDPYSYDVEHGARTPDTAPHGNMRNVLSPSKETHVRDLRFYSSVLPLTPGVPTDLSIESSSKLPPSNGPLAPSPTRTAHAMEIEPPIDGMEDPRMRAQLPSAGLQASTRKMLRDKSLATPVAASHRSSAASYRSSPSRLSGIGSLPRGGPVHRPELSLAGPPSQRGNPASLLGAWVSTLGASMGSFFASLLPSPNPLPERFPGVNVETAVGSFRGLEMEELMATGQERTLKAIMESSRQGASTGTGGSSTSRPIGRKMTYGRDPQDFKLRATLKTFHRKVRPLDDPRSPRTEEKTWSRLFIEPRVYS